MVMLLRWTASLAVALAMFAANAAPFTGLYYTSSPTSWVGHGETVTVTPRMGLVSTSAAISTTECRSGSTTS